MEWLLWAYPLIGAATIYPFALGFHHKNQKEKDHLKDSAMYIGFLGWACSLVWPVTGLIHGVGYLLTLEERREDSRKAENMSLETAYDVIAKHEAKQHEERRKRNERLRRDWTRLSGLEVGLDKPAMPWESERNPLWNTRWQRSHIQRIWADIERVERDLDRKLK